MSKRIEAAGVNAWFGAFQANDGVTMAIEPKQVAATWNPPHPDAPTQQLVFVAHVHSAKGRP